MWTHRRSGQNHQRGNQDHRDSYERDRTRVIHCPAFRRLQRKTQILGTGEGDFHRTRLTHSLEVASIGRSIVRNLATNQQPIILPSLLPNDDLISVICLLHDIGHPPFGHGGEVALNYMMRNHGGFEGNGQTLRLLAKTEDSYGPYGMDLTRRSLLGILKYPVTRAKVVARELPHPVDGANKMTRINDWLPPKAYFDSEQAEVDWLLLPFSEEDKNLFQSLVKEPQAREHGESAYRSFDCSIMNVADDIAYGVHDLEDAIHLRLIHREQLDNHLFHQLLAETPLAANQHRFIHSLFSREAHERKQTIGEMVNYFITATQITITNDYFENNLLKHNIVLVPEARALLDYFKKLIYQLVIDSQAARTFEYSGQTVILRLFEAISSNPGGLLDTKNRELFHQAEEEKAVYRIICDYIANMTDEYAYRIYERLFGFNTRTLFERL
ncbi:anti-phage deoxyguanosine triphosphatase [Legionella lansingensis]|nr:anti-phage deoxyguanosine triphosphatase [Legionella lansingensis]